MEQSRGRSRIVLVLVGMLGEILFAGTIFGFNALSLVLKDLNYYEENCDEAQLAAGEPCASQDSRLAIVWNAGVFSVNFSPAIAGVALDRYGPRAVASTGAALASIGVAMMALSEASPQVLLPLGASLVGLGGLSYHVSQFNAAQLFPSRRGFISSLYVGMFISSGIVFETVRAVFEATPGRASDYRTIMLILAALVLPFAPLMAWMAPRRSFRAGDRYQFDAERWRFLVKPTPGSDGAEVEGVDVVPAAGYALEDVRASDPPGKPALPGGSDPSTEDEGLTLQFGSKRGSKCDPCIGGEPRRRSNSLASSIAVLDGRPAGSAHGDGRHEDAKAAACSSDDGKTLPLLKTASRRPVHERWARLAQKPFKEQLRSPELLALASFFIFNVLALQFYLGTARIQLEEKGDVDRLYTRILSWIVPSIIFMSPLNGFLLDRFGYGVVLLSINTLSLSSVAVQMIDNLQVQVLNFILWAAARYLLYSSFFTIIGSIFSYRSFGRIVAIVSTAAGVLGLLQLPVTDVIVTDLDRNFTPAHIGSVVLVSLLYVPAVAMYRFERMD